MRITNVRLFRVKKNRISHRKSYCVFLMLSATHLKYIAIVIRYLISLTRVNFTAHLFLFCLCVFLKKITLQTGKNFPQFNILTRRHICFDAYRR